MFIFPGILMEGWFVRGVAIFGAIVSAAYAFLGVGDYINVKSGGKIKSLGWVKFAKPERGTEPFGPDDMPIITMYQNNDWAGLANEPTAEDRPMQLQIMLDEQGKEIYLQLCRYGVASVLQGIEDVKIIREPEYSKVIKLIKGMKM